MKFHVKSETTLLRVHKREEPICEMRITASTGPGGRDKVWIDTDPAGTIRIDTDCPYPLMASDNTMLVAAEAMRRVCEMKRAAPMLQLDPAEPGYTGWVPSDVEFEMEVEIRE